MSDWLDPLLTPTDDPATGAPPAARDKRTLIVEAALDVLLAEGIGKLSMRRVAREAGVALGLAHYYFASKGELIAALVGAGARRLRSEDPPPQAGVDVLGGEIVPLTKPASVVRASEIQVFGSAPKLAGASVAPPPSGSSSSSSGGSSSSSSSGGSSSGAATSSSSSGSTITPAAPGSSGSSSSSDQAGRFGGGALGLLLLVPGLALGLRRHRRLAA